MSTWLINENDDDDDDDDAANNITFKTCNQIS